MVQLGRYSFLIALVLIGALLIIQTWSKPRLRWFGVLGAVLILAGWWVLRPGASGSASEGAVQDALTTGKPVVVEIYSDY